MRLPVVIIPCSATCGSCSRHNQCRLCGWKWNRDREAQVDFGQGAWVLVNGKRKRPHLFRFVLSHSRKGYGDGLAASDRELHPVSGKCVSLLRRGARTLIIDNLRAAVTQADWYDPELNAKVAEFCRHYGTVMLPTRPAMPRHKGKIEAGVKFAQNNALMGRSFESLAAQNLFPLRVGKRRGRHPHSLAPRANSRQGVPRKGTRIRLLPLPVSLFPVFEEAPRMVHGTVMWNWKRAYYSVPPEYVGRKVWVRWESRLLRVINQRREVIAVHALAEPGKFTTDPNHLHSPYRRVVQQSLDYLLDRARLIGVHTGNWAR